MLYALAVLAGIAGAVVGWFITGVVAAWIAGLYGMSDFEGGRGMFAFLGVGPVGGLISMVGCAWIVLRVGKGPAPFAPTLARLAIVLGASVVLVGAGIWVRLETLDTYTDSAPPTLEFEIRVPADMPLPESSALRIELHTDKNVGESLLAERWVHIEGSHNVMSGSVPLDFKTASRLLVVSLPGQPDRLFRLRLSRDPQSTTALGAWRRPDHVHAEGEDQPRPVAADDPVELRYRVRRPGED